MIMDEYAEKMALQYCKNSGILVVNGRVPEDKVAEIKNYIRGCLQASRNKTRAQEADQKMKITGIDIAKALGVKLNYESPLEEFMALGLRRNDLLRHFKAQFQIGKYRVDLACEAAFLVVECDGHEYHFTEKSQIERDQKRDKYLSRKGWRILHFEGIAIRRNMDFCIEKVKEAIKPFVELAA